MSGVAIVGKLLLDHAPLVAIVPAERIVPGELPENVALPAILIRSTSVVDRQPLKRQPLVRITERVSVTINADTWEEQDAVFRLVRAAARGRTGAVAGFANVAVATAGAGPDLFAPDVRHQRTQDFRASYDAAA